MMTPKVRSRYALVSLGLDVALLAAAFSLLPLDWETADRTSQVAVPLAAGGVLGVFLAGGYRLAYPIRRGVAWMAALGLLLGLGTGWLLLKLLWQKGALYELNPPALEGFTLAAMGLAALAWAQRSLHLGALARHEARTPIALVAPPEPGAALVARLRERGWVAPVMTAMPSTLDLEALGPVHAVVLATPLSTLGRPELERLAEARARGLPVMTAARFEERLFGYTPLDTPDDPWLLLDEALERRSALYLGSKRLLDAALALTLGLVLLAPFAALVILLRVTTRGPVFYRQVRAGLYRRPFTLWKLRTMATDAERVSGPTFAAPDDPRVTPLGRILRRSRADELPQLWNVLRGDMSLVGPRPERPELDRDLAPQIPFYALRHLARPGLTGWAQVRMGYGASPGDSFRKLEHDVYYLKRASFWFDVEILLRTIPVVLTLGGR